MQPPYVLHHGIVARGYQFASGRAVGRADTPSPYPAGTLALQDDHFKARGLDLAHEVPGLVRATINVRVADELVRDRPDWTLEAIDWTAGTGFQIAPETFSFTRCCLAHRGRFFPGLIYLPHPETKPSVNDHDYRVIEVLSAQVSGLAYGDAVTVICRTDAFRKRQG